jgi:acyl-coenzyme A synthetase/AMP-(fatty) acid ligase
MRIYITREDLKDEVRQLIAEKTGLKTTCFEVNVIDSIPHFESGKINYRELN